ncbi:MAG: hypothetical protein WC276_02515 [Sedimentibacter sp.]|jgi:hypothetical protein|nr:hypothetical protein [Tissierellia bacterium]MDD4046902.1 hypothetical protein [Tissierellia bacterium]
MVELILFEFTTFSAKGIKNDTTVLALGRMSLGCKCFAPIISFIFHTKDYLQMKSQRLVYETFSYFLIQAHILQ